MKVMLLGAGKASLAVARRLTRRGAYIVVVADDSTNLDEFEVIGCEIVLGSHNNLCSIMSGYHGRMDVFIAATGSSEINLMSCYMMNVAFGILMRIAKVHNGQYLLLDRRCGSDMPIELGNAGNVIGHIVHQEGDVASRVVDNLKHVKGAGMRFLFDRRWCVLGLSSLKHYKDINTKIGCKGVIIGLLRGANFIGSSDVTEVCEGDILYIACDCSNLSFFSRLLHNLDVSVGCDHVVISSGGDFARELISLISKKSTFDRISIIEKDVNIARDIDRECRNVEVICGDVLDVCTLQSVDIDCADLFVGACADDSTNIIGSFMSKKLGCKYSAVISEGYFDVHSFKAFGADLVFSSSDIFVDAVVSKMQSDGVGVRVESFLKDEFVVFEMRLNSNNFPLFGRSIAYAKKKYGLCCIAVESKDKVFVPAADYILTTGSTLCFYAFYKDIPRIGRLLNIR